MASNSLILAFDTSAAHCAAALLSADSLLCARYENMARGQAECLMPMLQDILSEAGCDYCDLDAVAVGTGPGNFTGLRIAVAAARGLAVSLERPAIGVTGFEAVAWQANRPVISCLAAPRDGIFVQVPDCDPILLRSDKQSLPGLPEALPVAGPAAERLAGLLNRSVIHTNGPSAEAIARVAASRMDRPAMRPSPLYVRPADAAPARDTAPVILP